MKKESYKHRLVTGIRIAFLGLIALFLIGFSMPGEANAEVGFSMLGESTPDSVIERTSLAERPQRMLSAFFGLDNALPLIGALIWPLAPRQGWDACDIFPPSRGAN